MAQAEMFSKNKTYTFNKDCKSCRSPMKFNKSAKEYDELLEEFYEISYLNINQDDQQNGKPAQFLLQMKLERIAMRKVMFPINMNDVSSGDFMVIGDLNSLPLANSQPLKILDTLYNLISDHNSIDHPLCDECMDNILDQMDTQLKISREEYKMYIQFIRNYKENDQEDVDELEAELRKLKSEEAELEAKLLKYEAKKAAVKEMLKFHEEKAELIKKKEKEKWDQFHSLKHKLLLLEDSKCSVDNQLMYAQDQLNKLDKTNVFDATFHIWHSGPFGTINNFRLGRLPREPVEWPEINAAWGQTVLLLHCLAKKINLTFKRYRLAPYGNNSYIVPLDDKSDNLPLYCLGGGGIKWLDNKFDRAMVAFLDCLQQLKEEIRVGDKSFHLPYRMDKGKIEDTSARKSYSVKTYLNSEEQWTKALKFMLTNLKWATACVSTQFQDDK